MKIIKVSACFSSESTPCPYYEFSNDTHYCTKTMHPLTELSNSIQSWCPLEDGGTKKNLISLVNMTSEAPLCPHCNGDGWHPVQVGVNHIEQVQCEMCGGTGRKNSL